MSESAPLKSTSRKITGRKDHVKQSGDAYCMLTRIKDATYIKLSKRSYPLTEQHCFKRYYCKASKNRLNLAKYYTGLRCLFGKPGNLYDDWKGSFSFAFQVDVFRKAHRYAYLLHIVHMRSSIEFRFRKLVADPKNHDPFDLCFYHAPLEHEFSGEEMTEVEFYIYGYLQGYLQIAHQHVLLDVPDFVLLTESNQTISGYIDGKFFERHFVRSHNFEAKKNAFQDLIHNPVAKWPNDTHTPTTLTITLELAEGTP